MHGPSIRYRRTTGSHGSVKQCAGCQYPGGTPMAGAGKRNDYLAARVMTRSIGRLQSRALLTFRRGRCDQAESAESRRSALTRAWCLAKPDERA